MNTTTQTSAPKSYAAHLRRLSSRRPVIGSTMRTTGGVIVTVADVAILSRRTNHRAYCCTAVAADEFGDVWSGLVKAADLWEVAS